MKNLEIYFWLKKSQASKKTGMAPIMCRVSYGKKDEDDIGIGYKVLPEHWDGDSKKVLNGNERAFHINKSMDIMKAKLYRIEEEFKVLDQEVCAEIIKNKYENKGEFKKRTLLEIVDDFLAVFEKGVTVKKKGHSNTNLDKYKRMRISVANFIVWKYRRTDLFLSEINYDFAECYVNYLMLELKLGLGTVRSSYYSKLKKIVTTGFKKGFFNRHPFEDYVMEREDDELDDSNWLTIDEMVKIANSRFKNERLERIRHRTVLAMFTGLSFTDLENLRVGDIETDIKAYQFISKNRQKSDVESIIPIYKECTDILSFYSQTAHLRNGKILPYLSNKCYRDYLAEVLTLIGIEKKTTPHALRHSFAQVQIDVGASVEAVSKMLGHKNTRTVLKHYAKLSKAAVMLHKDKLQAALDGIEADNGSDEHKMAQ